jgi:two-component system, NarL family, nitrate/nitrite response regulator NarL
VGEECGIVIIDKYPIFRVGVIQAIRRDKRFTIVAEGATAEDAQQLVREKKPHILLLEAAVPGSLAVVQAILRAHRNVKVIILASSEDLEYASQVVHIGAHGYIMKGIAGPELVKAIAAVHGGEKYITPDLAWRLVAKPIMAAAPHHEPIWRDLSVREKQVLEYTSKGLSNSEIARTLGLGLSTIKYYKTLAFRKMGVRNRVEAVLSVSKAGKEAKA